MPYRGSSAIWLLPYYVFIGRIIDGDEFGGGEMVGVGGWNALGRDVALQRLYGNAVVLYRR